MNSQSKYVMEVRSSEEEKERAKADLGSPDPSPERAKAILEGGSAKDKNDINEQDKSQ